MATISIISYLQKDIFALLDPVFNTGRKVFGDTIPSDAPFINIYFDSWRWETLSNKNGVYAYDVVLTLAGTSGELGTDDIGHSKLNDMLCQAASLIVASAESFPLDGNYIVGKSPKSTGGNSSRSGYDNKPIWEGATDLNFYLSLRR